MPGGSRDFENEYDQRDAIPTYRRRRQAVTELERFDLGTGNVDKYQGKDGNDADEREEASQADDGSTQNVEA
jgi:hypothetical protein